jgi:hypothetical protein
MFMEIIKINTWTRWSKMKRFIVLMVSLCLIGTGCASKQVDNIEVTTAVKIQNYIGRFEGNVSLFRGSGDRLIIQKEQEEGFDIFNMDIAKPTLHFDYSVNPLDDQLYYKQLDANNTLRVKQLGNSEENNVLILEGRITKNIAKQIGYSETALVSTSPTQKYIVYCKVDDILNSYSLNLYNRETDKTLLLIEAVNEEVLNDMQGSIVWSPSEAYLVVANKQIFNAENGKLTNEINAESIQWSDGGDKLAYIKSENGLGKSISILDVKKSAAEEVFVVNQGEYLPGFIVWSENETRLAIVTASTTEVDGMRQYKAIYSLDLSKKEAVRIDAALQMEAEQVSKLVSMHYNSLGNILALTLADNWGSNLYVYNINTSEWQLFLNIEYLHYENNEDYICSTGNRLYFVQGQCINELDENMNFKQIHKSKDVLEDIYISKDGSSMIIIERSENRILLRQLKYFSSKDM